VDSAEASNQPIELALGGEAYRAKALTRREWGELQAWLKREVPGPIERVASAASEAEARGCPIPQATLRAMADRAIERAAHWPPAPGSNEWLDLLNTTEGGEDEFVWHALRRDNPTLSRDGVAPLIARMSGPEMIDLISVALYGRPPAPKSPGSTTNPAAGAEPSPSQSGTSAGESSPPSSPATA
jgi:hypothetical protein